MAGLQPWWSTYSGGGGLQVATLLLGSLSAGRVGGDLSVVGRSLVRGSGDSLFLETAIV